MQLNKKGEGLTCLDELCKLLYTNELQKREARRPKSLKLKHLCNDY